MEIRYARTDDLPTILESYAQARAFMRETGNLTQWQGGFPPRSLLESDIAQNKLYVCVSDGKIACVFYYAVEPDPTYQKIYNGAWKNDAPYGVIHRLGVGAHRGGVCSFCLAWCWQQHPNLRADTHRINLPMQGCLAKNGFHQCGIIYLADGGERLAYHKTKEK